MRIEVVAELKNDLSTRLGAQYRPLGPGIRFTLLEAEAGWLRAQRREIGLAA